jgi:hypothetical protein
VVMALTFCIIALSVIITYCTECNNARGSIYAGIASWVGLC